MVRAVAAPFSADEDLRGRDLRKAQLTRCYLARRDLSEADLSGVDLSGTDLTEARLVRANLSGAVLNDADLSFADLSGAVLTGASLDRADLSGSNLEGADLEEASLQDARLSWVLGLDLRGREELHRRGARIPVSWIALPWARLNALARRHAALVYVASMTLVVALAMVVAVWIAGRISGEHVYPMVRPGEGTIYQVDCGTRADKVFRGRAGYVGGRIGRAKNTTPQHVQRAGQVPAEAYLTERHGEDFGYRFRVDPGWYQVELHFAEFFHKSRGSRTFDINIEDQVVERNFDILAETFRATALVRRWASWVDDGYLDLRFKRRRARAKVSFIRIRRLDRPVSRQ